MPKDLTVRLAQKNSSALRPTLTPTVVAVALLAGYLASAGPAYYAQQRFILHPPSRVLLVWCQPTDWLARRSRLYFSYLQWWASKGIDAAVEHYMGANQSNTNHIQ